VACGGVACGGGAGIGDEGRACGTLRGRNSRAKLSGVGVVDVLWPTALLCHSEPVHVYVANLESRGHGRGCVK
jgi:hypothetical protein